MLMWPLHRRRACTRRGGMGVFVSSVQLLVSIRFSTRPIITPAHLSPVNSFWVRHRQGRRPIRDSPLGTPALTPSLYPLKVPPLTYPPDLGLSSSKSRSGPCACLPDLLPISRNLWKGSTRSPAVQGVMGRTRIAYCIIARRMGRTSFRWSLPSEMDSRRVSGLRLRLGDNIDVGGSSFDAGVC
jgi:hypothetical protein